MRLAVKLRCLRPSVQRWTVEQAAKLTSAMTQENIMLYKTPFLVRLTSAILSKFLIFVRNLAL